MNGFDEWFQIGIDNKWISDVVCDLHDIAPMTDDEIEQIDNGEEVCIPIVRITHGKHLSRMNEPPEPSIDLDRMRRASQQSSIDVVWMQAAIDYIDELLEHIERNHNEDR